MSTLNDLSIRHQAIMKNDVEVDINLDPQGYHLLLLEEANHMRCDFLMAFGFDGTQLRGAAPRAGRKRYQLTVPQSKERVDAIKDATTAGQMFYATHGQHLNSDELFEARAKGKREKEIKALKVTKETALKFLKQAEAARAIIEKKGQPTEENDNSFLAPELAVLATWKLGKPAKGKKEDLLKTYLGNPPPQKILAWSDHDEQNLQRLKNEAIQFKDTALSVALQQSANAVKTNVMHLVDLAANELME